MRFTSEILGVVESPLVEIATVAESMPGALKLCYGESDMPTPAFIRRAACEALEAGHTFYTHTAGYRELREAIAAKVLELHGVAYRPSEIMSTVGASMAIYAAIRACVGPGDNAVVVTPGYAIFTNAVILCGGDPRPAPLVRDGDRFRLDIDRIRQAIDGNTRMLIVNSPSNPTGWMMTEREQRSLCELADQHDVMILSDEVYERLAFDREISPSLARVAESNERLIVVNSFSKTYNMTGWRLGWAQGSERVIRLMYKAVEFMTSNPTAAVQQAGIVALRDGEAYVRELRGLYAARRELTVAALRTIPGLSLPAPDGAFYAFPRVEGLTDSTALTSALVRETGVAFAPGAAFGAAGEGYIRICFAASEHILSEALGRFGGFMRARAG